jgi:hypothetical protein
LDFARVHREEKSRAPIQETLFDSLLDGFDDFARQTAEFVTRGGFVFAGSADGDVFEEDSDALNGLGAQGALGGGELEGVADFVGEVARLEGFADGGGLSGVGGVFAEAGRRLLVGWMCVGGYRGRVLTISLGCYLSWHLLGDLVLYVEDRMQ